jgi:aminopeptidase N
MWVHEGFTTYSENLFIDYHYGKKAASEYVIGTRRGIRNEKPLIGPYNVNKGGSSDMYSKGANLLHTLRHVINDDEKWRNVLRGLNRDFYHKTVTTTEIENYISKKINVNLKPFFDQYLRDIRIPVLEYKIVDGKILYKWDNVIEDFQMPIDLIATDYVLGTQKKIRIHPTQKWKSKKIKGSIEIDNNYYVDSKYVLQ